MVKGLLALFFRVFKSSDPSPNTPFITSTNDGNNHNKQHNQRNNKSALKNRSWTFLGYLWSYEE